MLEVKMKLVTHKIILVNLSPLKISTGNEGGGTIVDKTVNYVLRPVLNIFPAIMRK